MSTIYSGTKTAWNVLKYRAVEGLYRLFGRLVLRRNRYSVKCSCGYTKNHEYVPSYRGATILERGYWKAFHPVCPNCGGGRSTIRARCVDRELGEALHRLPGYSHHFRKSLDFE